jgi:small subunit ribosomal protein S16
MAVKIRLQRHGRKKRPFYWIVAADARAKRDGKFLEKIGTYNPVPEIHKVTINVKAAVKWLQNGAIPTTTAKRLLSREGALLRNHLEIGVIKGAITEDEAEKRFKSWLADKEKRDAQSLEKKKKQEEKALKAKQEEAKKKAKEKEEVEKKTKEEEADTKEQIDKTAKTSNEGGQQGKEAPIAEKAEESEPKEEKKPEESTT